MTSRHAASSRATSATRPTNGVRAIDAKTASGGRCGAATRPGPDAAEDGAARPASPEQLGVLPQDALAQGLQLGPGVEPELVGQARAGGGVGLECLGLPTGPVQRHHEQGAEALVERVGGDEGLQLADDLAVPAGGELGRDEDVERGEPQLLEPGHLQPGGVDLVELREGSAAPEPEGLADVRRGPRGTAQPQRLLAEADLLLEPVDVDLPGRQLRL